MTDTAVTVDTKTPTTAGKMPPAVRLPKPVQMVLMAGFRRSFLQRALKRFGPVFAINVPFLGRSVVVSDPALARQVFLASTDDLINVQPNLSRIFGPGSVFALDGKEHRARRKLLAPPFHGQSIKNYEKVIEEETLRESANWPEGKGFRTLEPMNRITLNVILRTVFGADGTELDYLRKIIPP
jgi:cytochrome P450 family 138